MTLVPPSSFAQSGQPSYFEPGLVASMPPIMVTTPTAFPGIGQAVGQRVTIPVSGTLHDLAVWPGVQSGNVDIGVYSTASPRARLFSTGSVACPAAGAWRIVGDPNLAVVAGQTLDLALGCDNVTATFAQYQTGVWLQPLPANFSPGDGSSPYLNWVIGVGFPLPATIADGTLGAVTRVFLIIARVS